MILLNAAEAPGTAGAMMTFLPLILIFVIFYFMLIRPQKKREKETQAMRNAIDVGDEVITIGGIIGTVVSAREDYLLIETGSDRNKLRITRWAIQTNNTPHEKASSGK